MLTFFLFISSKSWSLEQNGKLWLAVNSQQTLTNNHKWLSFIYSQFRFINKSHPWQSTLIEGGLGYHAEERSYWVGYRWTAHQPNNGFYQENRLFQQIIWQRSILNSSHIIYRTRLEEIELTNQSQVALRLRQRVALEIDKAIYNKIFPFLYDEIFCQLNNTSYTPSRFIGENRLFIGINFYQDKTHWWEMGYINQYQMQTSLRRNNLMNHVISITYNFS